LYTENIIQTYHRSKESNNNKTIGCLISPHISSVRERIRVNGEPISEACFASYFWSLWDQMMQRHEAETEMPGYPGFLTLLAFYIFVQKAVDIAIIETGMGGETDTTNIIDAPIATGISALGLDHTARLGNTIQSIAWHKAGIFKRGRPAWSVPQSIEASDVLHARAVEKGTSVQFVDGGMLKNMGVAVKPDVTFQRENAALALSLAKTYVSQLDPPGEIDYSVAQCLETTEMPIKFEILSQAGWTWVLSSAHNEMSIRPVTQAFVETFRQ
jgi:folylpolyglutamate synthase